MLTNDIWAKPFITGAILVIPGTCFNSLKKKKLQSMKIIFNYRFFLIILIYFNLIR